MKDLTVSSLLASVNAMPDNLKGEFCHCCIHPSVFVATVADNCQFYLDDICPGADEIDVESVAEVSLTVCLDANDQFDHWDDGLFPSVIEWAQDIVRIMGESQ